MSIILPDTPSGHVWISSPTWIYDHWRWVWVLGIGAICFVGASIARKLDGRSFASGLLLVLSLGPMLVGAVCGIGSYVFWKNPHPATHHQTWSPTETSAQGFSVPKKNIVGIGYEEPEHDARADREAINSHLSSAFSLKVLQPDKDAIFLPADTDPTKINQTANKAPAYLNGSEVYSCVFLTNGITKDSKNQIIRIDVVSAACIQGDRSVRLTLR